MGMLFSKPLLLTPFLPFPRWHKNSSMESVRGKTNKQKQNPLIHSPLITPRYILTFQLGILLLWKQLCLQTLPPPLPCSRQSQREGRERLGRWESSPWQSEWALTQPEPSERDSAEVFDKRSRSLLFIESNHSIPEPPCGGTEEGKVHLVWDGGGNVLRWSSQKSTCPVERMKGAGGK